MNIKITGNTGFIGQNLVSFLDKNQYKNLHFLGRFTDPNWNTIGGIENTEVIIHLSGLAHDIKNIFTKEDYIKANYTLTKKIYDLFLSSEYTKTFVFISTIAVRDRHIGIFKEEDAPNPITYYGKSKLLAEQYILANLPKEKRVYILRPGMVHGEGNKGNLTLLYNFVNKGIPYPLCAYDNKRSFLSIDNLCFVIKDLIERNDIPSGIYHLADDEPVVIKDLIKLISDVTNKKIPMWKIPKFIINFIAKIGDYLPLPLNTERVMKITENYVVSNQKIKSALGKNLPVSSEDGLRRTIESFKK